MKTLLTMELSKKSLEEAKKFLNKYQEAYSKGIDNAVKYATEMMYNKVLEYCYANGISNHTSQIQWQYDDNTKTGRVWTNDMVIIFNEMGTGIVGSNNPHPNPDGPFKSWKYDVNEHGEKGWVYLKEDGTYGWTRGLPSRHMFYSAFQDIKSEIGNIVDIEIRKTVGDLY
nr:MAG TPA: putative tail component [Bacteriophage sp.]